MQITPNIKDIVTQAFDGEFITPEDIRILLDISLLLESLQKLRCFFPFKAQNSGHIFGRKAQIALAQELSHLPGRETHYELIRLDPHAYYLTTDMRPFQPSSAWKIYDSPNFISYFL